jgi:hypothetical protein
MLIKTSFIPNKLYGVKRLVDGQWFWYNIDQERWTLHPVAHYGSSFWNQYVLDSLNRFNNLEIEPPQEQSHVRCDHASA